MAIFLQFSEHLWQVLLCLAQLILKYPFLLSFSILLTTVLLIQFKLMNTMSNIRSSSSAGKFLTLPPSPPRLPVIGNLHQLGNSPPRSLRELSEKYGPLLLLHLGQTPTLLVSCPSIVKEIAKNHDIIFSNRPQTTASDVLLYRGKDLAFSPYGEYWRQVRRICVLELLSLKRVQSSQSVREEEVSIMVDKLAKSSLKGSTNSVNLSEIMVSTLNNIVSRCIIGQKYDNGEEEGGGSRLGELGRKVNEQFGVFSVGDYFPFLSWIDNLRGFKASLKSTARDFDAFCTQVIEERKAKISASDHQYGHGSPSTTSKDFVDILLKLQKDRSIVTFELTDLHIKAILQDMLVAGIDTTSTVIEWLMSELLKNPRVLKKAQEEVRRVVGDKAKVEMDDINHMDYLKCVIRECLRLHPPAPLLLPRQTSESVEIGGYHIPARTKVIVNSWAINRHPDFWDEPEEFIPERFEHNPVDFKCQDDFQLIPFGFGRRQCPGMKLGIINTEYLAASLLYWFDWKLPTRDDGDHELSKEVLDMSEIYGLSVHKKIPLHVIPIFYSP